MKRTVTVGSRTNGVAGVNFETRARVHNRCSQASVEDGHHDVCAFAKIRPLQVDDVVHVESTDEGQRQHGDNRYRITHPEARRHRALNRTHGS